LPEQEKALGTALSRLQTELESNRDAVNRTQQTRIILESNLDSMQTSLAGQLQAWTQAQHPTDATGAPVAISPNAPPEKKVSEALQEQLDVIRARYSDEHPDVIRLREELAKVKIVEEKRKSTAPAPIAEKGQPPVVAAARQQASAAEPVEFERTRQQVAALQAQIKGSDKELEDRKAEQTRILHELDSYQQRMERLPVREQEMAQVTRDYEMAKENYKSLLDKKMAAGMSLDMEKLQQSERFTVVDRAPLPEKPIKPNKPVLYAASVIVGLLLGLAIGFIAELRENVVLGEWELPAGTIVMARLPYIEVRGNSTEEKSRPGGWWFTRRKRLAGAVVTAVVLAGGNYTWLRAFLHRP
jgi:hypothetical protein